MHGSVNPARRRPWSAVCRPPRSHPPVIDFRLYRLAFLPALVAVVALMFSLEGAPDALEPAGPPGTFDAAGGERRPHGRSRPRSPIASREAPATPRPPTWSRTGSPRSPPAPSASSGSRPPTTATTSSCATSCSPCPGEASRTIVITAARDTADPPGAASSAAATGILLELAHALGERQHASTYVLASTSGSEAGAAGAPRAARRAARARGGRGGVRDLPARFGLAGGAVCGRAAPAASKAPPVQLERTAEAAVETQAGLTTPEEPAFTQLARLAIPSGLGEQAPLIAEGIDAVAISSAGERPLAAADDQLDDLGPESIDAFGRAIQSAIGAVDVAVAEPVHGPSAHIEVGRNLVPGWALAALALALILPAAVAAVDACARAMRARLGIGGALAWVAAPLPAVRRRARGLLRPGRGRARARTPTSPSTPTSTRPGLGPRSPSRSSCSPRRRRSPPCASGATPPPRRLRRPAARPSAPWRAPPASCSGWPTRTWRCCCVADGARMAPRLRRAGRPPPSAGNARLRGRVRPGARRAGRGRGSAGSRRPGTRGRSR